MFENLYIKQNFQCLETCCFKKKSFILEFSKILEIFCREHKFFRILKNLYRKLHFQCLATCYFKHFRNFKHFCLDFYSLMFSNMLLSRIKQLLNILARIFLV